MMSGLPEESRRSYCFGLGKAGVTLQAHTAMTSRVEEVFKILRKELSEHCSGSGYLDG